MNRFAPALVLGVCFAACAPAQSMTPNEVLDEAIAHESTLLSVLQARTPVAETYIQELASDPDFGTIPTTDHYFLGKVDLSHGITDKSYLSKASTGSKFDLFAHFLTIQYLPKGFAQMMLLDGGTFDRNHYEFEFLRREFLGDVRTLVFAVTPKKTAGAGHFVGQIWIEDRGCNVVRFNGTYSGSSNRNMYLHFDSWRINAGPDLWLPYEVYSEESHMTDFMKIHKAHFKALTRFWGYTAPEERQGELTDLTVKTGDVEDKSPQAADPSPVESLRAWQRQAEDNIVDRLERAGLIARAGGIDKVLDTVINNLEVTNNLNIQPEARSRVLLTTPIESFTIGHTIVISRGMLDTLPDEASLAAILAHELAHIALGQTTSTDFAFADRLRFDDDHIVQHFDLARSPQEEEAANKKAIEILQQSPYKDKLGEAGLFLKALGSEANRLPALTHPLFGDKLVAGHDVTRMAALMQTAPQLQMDRIDQIAALPLGSRTRLDPWTDEIEMIAMHNVPLVSAKEKLPFEITPVFLHLTYMNGQKDQVASK
ncbi:MAG TPA: M48 family metalloprotease [Bryobacteraceae bacterium]|nr:M48 family metalloprotease [Bryobacteraceae bacterium]